MQIVDECPGCEENHLDLFQDAFDQLAAESVGVIDLNWQYVECPSNLVTGPLSIHSQSTLPLPATALYHFIANTHRQ